MLLAGTRLALVHIGDSRAYLLRDGQLLQITHDHSLVQSMVDDGRLSAEEAASHPQRALLLRALAAGGDSRPDTELREARAGDRYLLCSDGLSAVVLAAPIGQVLRHAADPETAVGQLVVIFSDRWPGIFGTIWQSASRGVDRPRPAPVGVRGVRRVASQSWCK